MACIPLRSRVSPEERARPMVGVFPIEIEAEILGKYLSFPATFSERVSEPIDDTFIRASYVYTIRDRVQKEKIMQKAQKLLFPYASLIDQLDNDEFKIDGRTLTRHITETCERIRLSGALDPLPRSTTSRRRFSPFKESPDHTVSPSSYLRVAHDIEGLTDTIARIVALLPGVFEVLSCDPDATSLYKKATLRAQIPAMGGQTKEEVIRIFEEKDHFGALELTRQINDAAEKNGAFKYMIKRSIEVGHVWFLTDLLQVFRGQIIKSLKDVFFEFGLKNDTRLSRHTILSRGIGPLIEHARLSHIHGLAEGGHARHAQSLFERNYLSDAHQIDGAVFIVDGFIRERQYGNANSLGRAYIGELGGELQGEISKHILVLSYTWRKTYNFRAFETLGELISIRGYKEQFFVNKMKAYLDDGMGYRGDDMFTEKTFMEGGLGTLRRADIEVVEDQALRAEALVYYDAMKLLVEGEFEDARARAQTHPFPKDREILEKIITHYAPPEVLHKPCCVIS